MQHELTQIHKLIERKKQFLERCENEKTKAAIKAEINTIQNFINAAESEIYHYAKSNNKVYDSYFKLEDTIKRFECICIIHGINDYPALLNKDLKILMGQIKEMQKESTIAVPEKLKSILLK